MSSKTDQAYDILLERISNATYMAQAYIDEKAIAEELESSRTPVREALIALSREGFLKILPKRGIIVLPFSYQDALDIFQTRQIIEPWLIQEYGPELDKETLEKVRAIVYEENSEKIAERIRPGISMMHQPHKLLMERCKNQHVRRILADIEKHGRRIPNERVVTSRYVDSKGREHILDTHLRLIDMMEAGKFEEAAEEMVAHVKLAQDEYMNYWFK